MENCPGTKHPTEIEKLVTDYYSEKRGVRDSEINNHFVRVHFVMIYRVL